MNKKEYIIYNQGKHQKIGHIFPRDSKIAKVFQTAIINLLNMLRVVKYVINIEMKDIKRHK